MKIEMPKVFFLDDNKFHLEKVKEILIEKGLECNTLQILSEPTETMKNKIVKIMDKNRFYVVLIDMHLGGDITKQNYKGRLYVNFILEYLKETKNNITKIGIISQFNEPCRFLLEFEADDFIFKGGSDIKQIENNKEEIYARVRKLYNDAEKMEEIYQNFVKMIPFLLDISKEEISNYLTTKTSPEDNKIKKAVNWIKNNIPCSLAWFNTFFEFFRNTKII